MPLVFKFKVTLTYEFVSDFRVNPKKLDELQFGEPLWQQEKGFCQVSFAEKCRKEVKGSSLVLGLDGKTLENDLMW